MCIEEKNVFIISCLNSTFTYEWKELYDAIITFIYEMYALNTDSCV